MFKETNDHEVGVKTMSLKEISRVVHYVKDGMHDRVATKP